MAKTAAGGDRGQGRRSARRRAPDRVREPLSARAVGRPEAARRHCARAGHPSVGAAARRTAGRRSTPSCARKCRSSSSTCRKSVGITFVYVTHDQTEALALSHRIAVMNGGRVEQLDAPSRIYGFPRTRFVADFIGTCNLLVGPVAANAARHGRGRRARVRPGQGGDVGSTMAAGDEGAIALRPEKIRLHRRGRPTHGGQPLPRHRIGLPLSRRRHRLHGDHRRSARRSRRCSANSARGPHQIPRGRRPRRD